MIHMNLEASVDEWLSLTSKTVNQWLVRFMSRMKLSCAELSSKFVKIKLFRCSLLSLKVHEGHTLKGHQGSNIYFK